MRFLGIDAGGSKTIMAICDEAGRVQGTARMPGISLAACGGEEGLENALREGLQQLLPEGTLPDGLCFGAPCYGESEPGDAAIRRAVKACYGDTPAEICNDCRVAWAGSLALAPGVNVVAGTGTIGYGVDPHGQDSRCGGWSWHFSDEGSGYWLGFRLLELFCKQSDGRIPQRGPLHALVRERLGIRNDYDVNDLIENEYLPYRSKMAGLQLILLEAAHLGDESAIACYRTAGREIALIVQGILERLDFGGPADVSYSGGIFSVGDLVMESFAESLAPLRCRIVPPKAPPWIGALLLALRTRGLAEENAIANLIAAGKNKF